MNAQTLHANGNVMITTNSVPNLSAYASDNAGGLVHVGLSEADITFTNHNTTAIGDNTRIVAVGDFSMTADNSFNLNDDSESDGGGLISSADTSATVHLNSDTHGNVGTNASITANSVSIDAGISHSHAAEGKRHRGRVVRRHERGRHGRWHFDSGHYDRRLWNRHQRDLWRYVEGRPERFPR